MSTKYVLDPADRRRLLASPAGWIACGLGSGLTPKAQGTFGSLA
ncbi:MAG TPA: phosphatidylglycerophosphatase A, partial [Luteibacter sp.]|nr:phosphatidylglycerophosphatase A [Luteibacter sp.]